MGDPSEEKMGLTLVLEPKDLDKIHLSEFLVFPIPGSGGSDFFKTVFYVNTTYHPQ